MADPRLNSVHLDAVRREEFRRAREGLLGARGTQTVVAENLERACWPAEPRTIIQKPSPERPPDARWWLVDREYLYPLRVGLNTIGRAPDNDVVVQDAYVSRRHCAILVHAGDGFELHDIASKNGTFLNGQRISGPSRLKPGDEIRMCERHLVFMAGPEAGGSNPQATQTG